MLNELFNTDYSPEYTKSLPVIIVCLFIGVVAAAAVSLYHKHVLGSFIRFLRTSGACDESTAVTLDKTKYKNNVFVKAAIKNGRTYACVLRSVYRITRRTRQSFPEKKKGLQKSFCLRSRVIIYRMSWLSARTTFFQSAARPRSPLLSGSFCSCWSPLCRSSWSRISCSCSKTGPVFSNIGGGGVILYNRRRQN